MTLRVDTDFLIHALATGGAPSARSWTGFPIVRRVCTASEPISYKGPPSIRYRVPAPGCTLTPERFIFAGFPMPGRVIALVVHVSSNRWA